MKKFKFTLQTVHNVREMRREKEELVLAEMQTEVNRAIAYLSELERTRLEAIENYTRKLKQGEVMNPLEMELNTNHLRSLDLTVRKAQAEVEQKQREFSAQSKVVAAAGRAVKVTERLRENQQSRHQTEHERREQIAIDDLVSANFARRMLPNE